MDAAANYEQALKVDMAKKRSLFNRVHFSSTNLKAKTPLDFYEQLNKEFKFTFDPCPVNPTFNGLEIPWKKRNFVNPPYGHEIGKWIRKAYEESLKNKLCVLLIPSRTDTAWFHDYVMKAKEIRFIRGRLVFQNYNNSAPFPSCVVVFKK